MPNRTVLPLYTWNLDQAKEVIWEALHMAREDCISPDNNGPNDAHWDDICTAMAWIQDAADCNDDDYVTASFDMDGGEQ